MNNKHLDVNWRFLNAGRFQSIHAGSVQLQKNQKKLLLDETLGPFYALLDRMNGKSTN
jgi:hypothetical protein